MQCTRRFGDFYRLPLGSGVLVVNDPEHIAVWLTDYDRFVKGKMSRAIEPALGLGIPISDGDRWRRNRRAMNPMFARRNLDRLAAAVATSIQDSLERWELLAQRREVVDVYREVSILTMQVLQRTMFSSTVADAELPELVDAFDHLRRWMGGLMLTYWLPGSVPAPGYRAGRRARQLIHDRIVRAVQKRRESPTDDVDLLNLLLAARSEDGVPLSDEEVYDELLGLWFGGYDTTGSALTWTLAMLSQNPEAAEALRAESDAYSGDFDTMADLTQLTYAKAAFDEGQRMQGALLLTRDALQDCEIAEHHVPAGSMVGLSAFTLNRHPAYWRDPDRFDPSRFLGDEGAAMHKYQFVMFGGGPRHCIGAGLAYLEAQSALTMIARRFHVQPQPGWTPRHDFHLSVGVRGGMPSTIRLRAKEA
jgi:cytochrome P450